jgi:DNA-binding NtrC family response regulator
MDMTAMSSSENAPVLLVDDNQAVLDGLTELLRLAGLLVASCRTFAEAKAFALTTRIRALVTDVRLGEHNGLHLVHFFRPAPPGARLFAFSGHDDPVLKRDAEALGATFLLKPLDIESLVAELSKESRAIS